MNNQPIWPEVGDKVTFIGVPQFYYPQFPKMRTFCDANLTVGQEYTIHKLRVNSSWVSVYIVGFEQEMLNWAFFRKAIKTT
jgi:hypothetical protein